MFVSCGVCSWLKANKRGFRLLMPGVCANPWQTYDCEWGFRYLWRWIDWVGRADIIALVLMLACVLSIVSFGLYRYYLARHQSRAFLLDAAAELRGDAFENTSRIAEQNSRSPIAAMVSTWLTGISPFSTQFTHTDLTELAFRAVQRSERNLKADFIFELGTLQSIAYAAPFLGLAGACLVILSGLSRGIAMEKHAATVMIASEIAAALVPTTVGLLVAVVATWSYNYLWSRVEMLKSEMSEKALEMVSQLIARLEPRCQIGHLVVGPKWYDHQNGTFQFAQGLPLGKQVSTMPPYGLLTAPCVAIFLAVLMAFLSFHTPVGLSVRLLKSSELETNASKPVVVAVEAMGANEQCALYVNSTKTPGERLAAAVNSQLGADSSVAYIEAEDEVTLQTVSNAIAVVRGIPVDVVLVTAHNRANAHGLGKGHKSSPR